MNTYRVAYTYVMPSDTGGKRGQKITGTMTVDAESDYAAYREVYAIIKDLTNGRLKHFTSRPVLEETEDTRVGQQIALPVHR